MDGFLTRLRRRVQAGDEGSPTLRFWSAACVLVSVFAITAHYDFGTLRYSISGLVVAGYLFSWRRRRARNTWVKVGLTLGCLVAAWVFLQSLSQDPYHTSIPLTVFLLWLQTLHSFDLPRRRDLLFSLLTSVVLMAVAAAFSVDVLFGAYVLPYIVAATVALVYNAAEAGAAAAGGSASAERGEGPGVVSVLRGREVVRPAAALLGLVLVVAAVVFLLTPRLPGLFISAVLFTARVPLGERLQGRIVNPAYPEVAGEGTRVFNPNGYFGFGPSVDLRVRGRLNDAVVMRVRTTERRLWRGLVFDVYTGTGWRIDDHRVRQHTASVPPIELVAGRDDVHAYRARTRRLVQTFYIQQEQPNVAFAVPRAEHIYLPGDHVYVDRYSSIRLPFTLDRGMVYTVVSRPLEPSPEQLQRAGTAYPSFILERYLQLPPELPARVRTLAADLTGSAGSPYEAAQAVNRFLWTQYRYDLTIGPQRRPGDAVDYFLFEERRGYCEQFASAMAVLLRAAGIPARLATGYTPGAIHPITGLLEVRNSDAHAWVEVFFPGIGWVEFEPTPSFPDPALLGDAAVPRWGFQGFARYLGARLPALAPPAWAVAGLAATWRPLLWVLGLAGVLLLALRVPAFSRSPRADPVLEAYATVLRLLARRGLRRRTGETPREFAVRTALAFDWPEMDDLTTLVERSAFGPEGTSPEAAVSAHEARVALMKRDRARPRFDRARRKSDA